MIDPTINQPAALPTPNPPTPKIGMEWPVRLRAAGIHLCISLGIAALSALLVFALWYPYPYREISSGRELFLLVVTVDVILGPLITLAIFNRAKPRAELKRDLGIIGFIQLAALLYGLWTVFIARPVHLVFEYNRFRVVHALDVPEALEAKMGAHTYPWGRPSVLALRPFANADEEYNMTIEAVSGTSLSARPELWMPYEKAAPQVLAKGQSVASLLARFPEKKGAIDSTVASTGVGASGLLFIPMVGRKTFWTVLIDAKTAEVQGFLPIDSF